MPYALAKPQTMGRPAAHNRVLAMRAGPGSIRFSFTSDIAEHLDIKPGDGLAIHVGAGKDAGNLILIKAAPGTPSERVNKGSGHQLAINVRAVLLGRSVPKASAVLPHKKLRTDGRRLMIDISHLEEDR